MDITQLIHPKAELTGFVLLSVEKDCPIWHRSVARNFLIAC